MVVPLLFLGLLTTDYQLLIAVFINVYRGCSNVAAAHNGFSIPSPLPKARRGGFSIPSNGVDRSTVSLTRKDSTLRPLHPLPFRAFAVVGFPLTCDLSLVAYGLWPSLIPSRKVCSFSNRQIH